MGGVLDIHIPDYQCTLGSLFVSFMEDLWVEGEGFSGKRPGWRDSDWQEIVTSAVRAWDPTLTREGSEQIVRKALREDFQWT